MDIGKIYIITCKITNLCYIGQTTQHVNKRFEQHMNKSSCCRLLKMDVSEYGRYNFDIKTIWEGDVNELNRREREFIDEYNTMYPNGYNLRQGGGKHEKVSEESIKLMILKQRQIRLSKTGGKLGSIRKNKSKIDGRITSWTVRACHKGKVRIISKCSTEEEAFKVQEEFTRDPDNFKIPNPVRKGNGKARGIYFEKSRNKWMAMKDNKYIGRYVSEDDAKKAIESFTNST